MKAAASVCHLPYELCCGMWTRRSRTGVGGVLRVAQCAYSRAGLTTARPRACRWARRGPSQKTIWKRSWSDRIYRAPAATPRTALPSRDAEDGLPRCSPPRSLLDPSLLQRFAQQQSVSDRCVLNTINCLYRMFTKYTFQCMVYS
jgi:hypothetical protein